VPDLTLDQMEDDLVRLVRTTTDSPPHTAYAHGRGILSNAMAALDRTQVLSQRRRLYLVAGHASALLAVGASDLGSVPAAEQLLRAAALYGQVAEYGPLRAYAHGYLAILAYMQGNSASALRLVHTAQRFEGVGDTGRARLAAIEARAFGYLGRSAEADRAIRVSLGPGAGKRDELHDDLEGEFGFPAERVAMSNSTTYLLLGRGADAERSASRSLELIAGGASGTTGLNVASKAAADLAQARLLRAEIEGAAEALTIAFRLPVEWRTPGLRKRLEAVRTQLAVAPFRGSSPAGALAERIEEFVRARPAAEPSVTVQGRTCDATTGAGPAGSRPPSRERCRAWPNGDAARAGSLPSATPTCPPRFQRADGTPVPPRTPGTSQPARPPAP
jgi:hypothetical protein